jgi:HlyD family secretion protein
MQVDQLDSPSDALIRVFQSETGEIRSAPEPLRARITLWVLAAMLLSLGCVASVFRIDRTVTSQFGQVVTTQPTTVLQALDPSIIKTLDVKEGDRVKKGQLLATLDSTFTAADVRALRSQISSLDAQIARDTAELAGQPFDVSANTDPMAVLYERIQKLYYEQRKSQYQAQVNAFDEQAALAQATLKRLGNDEDYYRTRASVAQDIEKMRADLEATKVGSRLNLLLATDQKLELERYRDADAGSKVETIHQLAAAMFNRNAFIQQWLGQASQELITARNQRDNALEQLAKAEKHQSLVRLDAPDDAVVLTMAKLSVGSVLRNADPLITLAMLHSPMEAEVYITPRDVGFVRPGDRVTIKLDSFQFIEHGTVDGEVLWISDGTFNADPGMASASSTGSDATNSTGLGGQGKSGGPYYKMRIRFTKVDLTNVPAGFQLIPGMTLTADIHLGTRSLMMYLVRGMMQGIGEAMREP